MFRVESVVTFGRRLRSEPGVIPESIDCEIIILVIICCRVGIDLSIWCAFTEGIKDIILKSESII
jgi:hypothetical protein